MFQAIKTRLLLFSLRRRLQPRTEFRHALEARILSETKQMAPMPAVRRGMRPFSFAMSLAVVVLLLSGTTAYAYTNDAVVDGTPLYPVRMAVEQMEELTAVTSEVKAAVRLRHVQRRLKEAERLLKTRPGYVLRTLRKIETGLDATMDDVSRLDGAGKERVMEGLDAKDAAVVKKFEQFSNSHPRVVRSLLRQRVGENITQLERRAAVTEDTKERTMLEARLERRKALLIKVSQPIIERQSEQD